MKERTYGAFETVFLATDDARVIAAAQADTALGTGVGGASRLRMQGGLDRTSKFDAIPEGARVQFVIECA